MTGNLTEYTLKLKQLPYSRWFLLIPVAALVALAANFAAWLFVAVLGVGLFYYFWLNQQKLVLFLIVYTPFEEFVLKWLPDSLYAPTRYMWEGMLLAMMGLMLVERLLLSRTWKSSLIDRLMLLFMLGWFVSGVINHVPLTTSLIHIKNIVRYVPLFYIIYNLRPDQALVKRIISAVIIIGVVQSLLCIGQALGGEALTAFFQPREVTIGGQLIRGPDIQLGSYHTKFTGTFARANELANYLAVVVCFLVAACFTMHRRKIYLWSLLPVLAALIVTSSRISWLSAFLGVAVILFTAKYRHRYAYLIIPVLLVVLFTAGGSVIDSERLAGDFNIAERFTYVFTSEYVDAIANTGRLYAVLRVVPSVFLANPLLGVGPGSFMYISQHLDAAAVFGKADALGLETLPLSYVHDVGYVALFVQAGLLGVGALIWMFVRLYRRARSGLDRADSRTRSTLLLGGLGFFVALAVQNLACYNITYRNQSLVIWTVCGLIALLASKTNDGEKSDGRAD